MVGVGKGVKGDAYVEITVKPSAEFNRVENDLESTLSISFAEAILGGEVKAPTLDGSVLLKVPPKVSSGTRLRIKGKGVPITASTRGDQFCILKITVPATVDLELTSAVEAWLKRQEKI
jgi:DnaJ-class molecular chaperone